MALLFDKEKR